MKKIYVRGKEFETKEGKKFTSYRSETRTGEMIDTRFTTDCKTIAIANGIRIPEGNCSFYMIIDETNRMNNVSNKYRYPRFYVNEVKEIITNDNNDMPLPKLPF